MDTPPSRYAWENSTAGTRYRQWQQRYEQAITQYSVCKLITQIGPNEVHPDAEPL
jgi:hypothetical protein